MGRVVSKRVTLNEEDLELIEAMTRLYWIKIVFEPKMAARQRINQIRVKVGLGPLKLKPRNRDGVSSK